MGILHMPAVGNQIWWRMYSRNTPVAATLFILVEIGSTSEYVSDIGRYEIQVDTSDRPKILEIFQKGYYSKMDGRPSRYYNFRNQHIKVYIK